MNTDLTCTYCKILLAHQGAKKNHEKACLFSKFEDESPIKFNRLSTSGAEDMEHEEGRSDEPSDGGTASSRHSFEDEESHELSQLFGKDTSFGESGSLLEPKDLAVVSTAFSSDEKIRAEPDILGGSPGADDDKEFEKCVNETITEHDEMLRTKLDAAGVQSILELEVLNLVASNMLPQTTGEGIFDILHRASLNSTESEFSCRKRYKSAWKSVRKRAFEQMIISKRKQKFYHAMCRKSGLEFSLI